MKIIGFTEESAIVELQGSELAKLMGKPSVYEIGDIGWRKLREKISVGSNIDINAMWDWLVKARGAYDKIKSSTSLLRSAADILDQAPPVALREEEKS